VYFHLVGGRESSWWVSSLVEEIKSLTVMLYINNNTFVLLVYYHLVGGRETSWWVSSLVEEIKSLTVAYSSLYIR
jgi:hypothetical protein